MILKKLIPFALWSAFFMGFQACNADKPKDGNYELQLLTTNDVHGHWFDSTYVNKNIRKSLFAANHYVDSIRNKVGKDNVILVDAGDCLQGDNAAYYFNYVDTITPHIFPRLVKYMEYDAVAVGNHDIETGHPVYDRVAKEMKKAGIPFLAGNAIRTDNGKTYFPLYTIIKRHGLKIAILGYTNPNIKEWLTEKIWKGIDFKSLIPLVQNDVNSVRTKENPDIVIVVMHSGTGKGDGSIYECQGMDLFKTIKGVDFLVCSHDHKPFVTSNDSLGLINSGSHCRYLGHGILDIKVKNGKIVSKKLQVGLIPIKANEVDTVMRNKFHNDYLKVKDFTLQKVGKLDCDMFTRDSYKGMCEYINLIHCVSRYNNDADISFAAPLTFNGFIKAGTLTYNDLFKIYPYENQLFIVKLTGKQIKDYLEFSYDQWINSLPDTHLLKIINKKDERYGQNGWSFINRSYNFDSAGGLIYTVNVQKPFGKRINIEKLANGNAFEMNKTYKVAMTSYRASGGGELLTKGAGISHDKIKELIIERHKEIRDILYDYIKSHKSIKKRVVGDRKIIGEWKFIPYNKSKLLIDKDMNLLFGE